MITSEDQEVETDCWYFDPEQKQNTRQANELSFGRVKLFLLESLYRSITKHDLFESFHLARLLPKVTYLDPYVLFRFIMILVESNKTESVNKNVIIYLEQLFSKLYMNKPEVFVELLSYFIKHNRIEDAQELYSQRSKYMSLCYHQKIPSVEINLKCYEFVFTYLQWEQKLESQKDIPLSTDLSLQGRLVNIIDCLKSVTTNHEYFLLCLIRILVHNGYQKKAYLLASKFRENNPDNISANLLLLDLLKTFNLISPMGASGDELQNLTSADVDQEALNLKRVIDCDNINNFTSNLQEEEILPGDYPFDQDRQSIIKDLRRLDPSGRELLDIMCIHSNYLETLRDLMDGMEFIREIGNSLRWFRLKTTLDNIFNSKDENLILDARLMWHSRYRRFWKKINFLDLIERNNIYMSDQDKQLIEQTEKMISTKLNRPARY